MEKLRMEKMISKLCSVRNEDCTCHTSPHASWHTCIPSTTCIFVYRFYSSAAFGIFLAMIIIYMLIRYGNMCVLYCIYLYPCAHVSVCCFYLSFFYTILNTCAWSTVLGVFIPPFFCMYCCYETSKSSFVEPGEDLYMPWGNKGWLAVLPLGSPVPLKLWVAGRMRTPITVVSFGAKQ